jgi:hypothetical protein
VKLEKDLREFIESLNSKRVEFIVVGGHAVAFHGHPRYTGDIDIFIRQSPENVLRLIDAISAFGFTQLGLKAKDLLQTDVMIQLGHPPNRIDLLTDIAGVEFEEAWAGRVAGGLDDLPVFFLDLKSLLKNKRAMGRDKDLADVNRLSEIEREIEERGL